MKAILEGLLFVVGDDGITYEQIEKVLEISESDVLKVIDDLKNDYSQSDRGLRIESLGNTLKLTTKREHKEYYKKIVEEVESRCLSQASLETLAIITYNEPVTRMQVDEIRGISSINIIKKLLSKGFLKVVGRGETIGKPILYSTTDEFLDYFGLSSKEDLPKLNVIKEEVTEEQDLFLLRYQEEIIN